MRIGPFQLERAIGKGGMAVVWLARHRELDRLVAIKVLIGERARDAEYVKGMEYEIRACARLHHPGIIDIFDFGELSADVATSLGLQEGAPYYVMEYVDNGTLKDVALRPDWGWALVHQGLLDVLEALAHAHARQIIHRDLKPANILFRAENGRLRAMLADFGVAGSRELDTKTRPDLLRVTGTPKYMAPEQVRAEWRDQGPWTDLYALGCIAFWMVTGHAPFEGANHIETLKAHLSTPPPALDPKFAVPPGFRAWVMTLLNKDPGKRFRCAADAAYALNGLGDASTMSHHDVSMTLGDAGSSFELLAAEASGEFSDVARSVRPPIAAGWARGDDRKRDQRLIGAGLRLFDWRAIPFVERVPERDLIWRALRQVHSTHQPRLVLIEGDAGTGKSRLVEWISQRAAEMGSAAVLKAHTADFDPTGAALAAMVAECFHCENLSMDRTRQRIEDGLTMMGSQHNESLGLDIFVLSQLVSADHSHSQSIPEQDRVAAAARLIERMSTLRTVIVWLDNVHLSPSIMPLVHRILQKQDARVLFLATYRSEAIPENESLRQWVEGLSAHPSCERICLDPLMAEDQRELVRQLLLLDEEVVSKVVSITGGNPLFAVELIGEWIRKGQLRATSNGFALASDASLATPTAVHDIWLERVKTLVSNFALPESIMRALELAAIMGSPVDAAKWRKASACVGIALPSNLVPKLIERRVCKGNIQVFSFEQDLLRDALIRNSKTEGNWRENNKICASLMQSSDTVTSEYLTRLGMHLVAAEQWVEALEPLRKAVEFAIDRENIEAAARLLNMHAEATRGAALSINEHDVIFNACQSLWIQRRRGAEVDINDVRNVRRRAKLNGFWLEYSHASRLEGALARASSLHESAAVLREAAELLRPLGGLPYGMILAALGRATMFLGEVHESIVLQEEASDIFFLLNNTSWLLMSKLSMIYSFIQAGESERALYEIQDVLTTSKVEGMRDARAEAYAYLGEVHRHEFRYDDALRAYENGHALMKDWDPSNRATAALNIALSYLGKGDFEEAHIRFMQIKSSRLEHVALEGGLELALCATTAYYRKWKSWDMHWERAQALLDGAVDFDLALTAELAADITSERNEDARARTLYTYSARIWSVLGRRVDLERVEGKLRASP